jgi:hypothetical protein
MRLFFVIMLLAAHSQAQQSKVCSDPFARLCSPAITSQVGSKHNAVMKNMVLEAQDTVFKKIGTTDRRSGFIALLKENGLEIAPELSAQRKNEIIDNDSSGLYLDLSSSFTIFKKCTEASSELYSLVYLNDIEKLKAKVIEYTALKRAVLKTEENLYASDTPALYNELKQQCSRFASLPPDAYLIPSTPIPAPNGFSVFCSFENVLKLRTEAIKVYRKGTKEAGQEFVTKYLPQLREMRAVGVSVAPAIPASGTPSDLEALQEKARALQRTLSYAGCFSIQKPASTVFVKLKADYYKSIELTKEAHDFLIDKIYTPDRKKVVEELIDFTKANLVEFLEQNFSAKEGFSQKLMKIRDEYKKLQLLWPEKLPSNYYVKTPAFPLPVLDLDRLDELDESWFSAVSSNLWSFTTFNAYYHPQYQIGTQVWPELFTLLPGFLEYYSDDPRGLIGVIGHELAHKIGWSISKMNGHDLRSEYKSVVQCLASSESIKLIRNRQEDESLADWLASNVIADYAATQPVPDQLKVIAKSVEDFCLFADFASPRLQGVHPEPTLRVNGIYGANKKIRAAWGCNDQIAPYDYITCEINSQVPNPSPGQLPVPLAFPFQGED